MIDENTAPLPAAPIWNPVTVAAALSVALGSLLLAADLLGRLDLRGAAWFAPLALIFGPMGSAAVWNIFRLGRR